MKCPVCGKECGEEDNFCSRCGAKLRVERKEKSLESLDRMIQDFQKKIEDNPKDPDIYYNLALAYAMKKDDQLAIIQLQKVLAIDPSFSDALLLLGKLYIRQKKYEEARKYLLKVLEVEPNREAEELLKRIEKIG